MPTNICFVTWYEYVNDKNCAVAAAAHHTFPFDVHERQLVQSRRELVVRYGPIQLFHPCLLGEDLPFNRETALPLASRQFRVRGPPEALRLRPS